MRKRGISWLLTTVLLVSLMATLMTGCSKEVANVQQPVVTTPLLRIGILSDVHLSRSVWGDQQHDRLEKALLVYRQKGVDGILIAGDLQENTDAATAMTNIEEFTDIWFSVFPNNTNPLTREHVEPLFIYGNHDVGLVNAEYWPDRLGTYEEAWHKEVKGYQFVGAHYTMEWSETAANLVGKAEALSEDKPFFYVQHQPMKGTLYNCNEGLQGTGGALLDIMQGFENCVVFSGHTHIPITDERSIWQTDKKKGCRFTAVNCATTNYAYIKNDGLDINGDADETQQGMYMVVDGSIVTLERYSFANMKIQYNEDGTNSVDINQVSSLGAPWVFDALQKKKRPYDYETRFQQAQQPVFAEGAALDVGSVGTTYANVFIPPATVGAEEGFSDLVQSYYIEAIDPETGEVVSTSQVASEYHVDISPERLNKEVYIGIDGLEPGKTYILNAYARECYQKASEPLTVEITTLTE